MDAETNETNQINNQPNHTEKELSKTTFLTDKTEVNKKIGRHPRKFINSSLEDFTFMQIDVDNDMYGEKYDIEHDNRLNNTPILRIYGINDLGNSVCLIVEDFFPYFYLKKPNNFMDKDFPKLKEYLEKIIEQKKSFSEGFFNVMNLEIVNKVDLMNYNQNTEDFIKITLRNPQFVSCLRDNFEKEIQISNFKFHHISYESKLNFPLRYMIDNGIVGISWLTLQKDKYKVRDFDSHFSTCQIEVSASYKNIIAHSPNKGGEFSRIAPLRILSFDIECANKDGHFPSYKNDPVIQISNICVEFGRNNNEPIVQNLFSLKECADITGAKIHNYEKEADMLKAWADFIVELDPDIIIGYNINNFDFPYLLNRAKLLGVKNFDKISRIKATSTKAKVQTGNSAKSFNNREMITINMDGRSIIDMYLLIVKDHKLRSNTLNNVAFHFLGQQKEDVHHTMIYGLWQTNKYTRRRLGMYCLKDAYLPWRLCQKLMTIYNYAAMCRVTSTPLNSVLSRGQQIKVFSQIHKYALDLNYLIPTLKIQAKEDEDEEGYEGAFVLDPKPKFYTEPIATLDFASLYPSIMIAHNLCYTTLVRADDVNNFKPEDVFKSPNGETFVKKHIREGILPRILEELIAARKATKKEIKETNDESKKAVLDGRQLALKVSANSVYGFTGAQVGQLPCIAISASVTSVGRSMIERTKNYVEQYYTQQNNYKYNADVVYGDTDSVMIKFGVSNLEEAMKLGKEASDLISKEFISPIKLEFEKVYMPYLLMKKKRYAGVIWTKLDKYDKIDSKGLETVRRDNCKLVNIVFEKSLNLLLLDKDGIEKALELCKGTIADLLKNRVDLSNLIISKSISRKIGDDANTDANAKRNKGYVGKQAHVELAEKMKKRDEGTAPSVGDRVPYVMIKGTKNSKNYENSEDPKFVLENDCPIDTNYYIENQLKKPLIRLFEHVLSGKIEAEKLLFSGKHMNDIVASSTNKSNPLFKFIVPKQNCLGCKIEIKSGAVCKNCISMQRKIYIERKLEANYFERLYSDLWTQCQRCQGSLHQEVICQNNDCPIFYKREKVRKEVQDCNKKLERFDEKPDW